MIEPIAFYTILVLIGTAALFVAYILLAIYIEDQYIKKQEKQKLDKFIKDLYWNKNSLDELILKKYSIMSVVNKYDMENKRRHINISKIKKPKGVKK